MIPRLHVVTNDAVLSRDTFLRVSRALLESHESRIALHLRGHDLPARRIYDLAAALCGVAKACGSLLIVNDRVDVALTLDLTGVHLGRLSLPVDPVRQLVGPSRLVGVSVHEPTEAPDTTDQVDYVMAGSVFASSTHPGRPGRGLRWLAEVADVSGPPVLGIGGVSVETARSVSDVGYGIAVISGVWNAADPVDAVSRYLVAVEG